MVDIWLGAFVINGLGDSLFVELRPIFEMGVEGKYGRFFQVSDMDTADPVLACMDLGANSRITWTVCKTGALRPGEAIFLQIIAVWARNVLIWLII